MFCRPNLHCNGKTRLVCAHNKAEVLDKCVSCVRSLLRIHISPKLLPSIDTIAFNLYYRTRQEGRALMRIVYVLTSGKDDLYFEQFWISAISARKHNPTAEIILLTDKDTEAVFSEGYRKQALQYVTKVVSVDLSDLNNAVLRSRYLKTKMRDIIEGDFLYIDCDTVVSDSLEGAADCKGDVSIVLDRHKKCEKSSRHYHGIMQRSKLMGYHLPINDEYYNSGAIFARDTPLAHEFFDLWHTLWQQTRRLIRARDQVALNEANYRMGGIITELDGAYNFQINSGMKYLITARVIHYFADGLYERRKRPLYVLSDWEMLSRIKENERITDEVQKVIDEPKSPRWFCDGEFAAIGTDTYDIITGGMIDYLRSMQRHFPRLYRMANEHILKKQDKASLRQLSKEAKLCET